MSLKQRFNLEGKTALITGGSRGLGRQIAEGLGEYGARVVLTARKQHELDEAKTHLEGFGIETHVFAHDLSQFDTIEPLVTKLVQDFGAIDILVNNAGAAWGAPAEDHPFKAWLKVVDLNLNGVFLLTQAIGKHSMIPRKAGRIINIASVAGLQGNPPQMMGTLAYNTTKGGVVNFTRALAAEWGKYGITVNSICPGYFPTRMTRGTLEYAGDLLTAATPLGRLGGEEDLKGAALLFASDAGAFITGQNLAIDGGLSVV